MKSYKDEDILKKRMEEKKKQHKSLQIGYFIKDSIVHFEKQIILERLVIQLPDTWKQMPQDYAKVKYPSEFRPHQIMCSIDLSINLGFSIFPSELQVSDIEQMTNRIMNTIQNKNYGIQFEDFKPLTYLDGYWFSFRSHAMDADMYNMMLISPIEGTFMQISFNCPYEESADWKHPVILMWESIEFLEKRMNII